MYRCIDCNWLGDDGDQVTVVEYANDGAEEMEHCPECGAYCDYEDDLSELAAQGDMQALEASGLDSVPCFACGFVIDTAGDDLSSIHCPSCGADF